MSVLVVLEQSRGVYHRMSWEALAAGFSLGLPVSAAVIGEPGEAALKGIERLYTIPAFDYSADGYTAALAALIAHAQPEYVLFPHTYQVRDFAPKLATRLGRVLVSDVVKLNPDGSAVRQHFQGKLNADYRFTGPAPVCSPSRPAPTAPTPCPPAPPPSKPFRPIRVPSAPRPKRRSASPPAPSISPPPK